ncbi:MAG TPA: Ni/Fe-hydrogenase cytochrome b subunit, partial [Verrucomicrobiae bacterium]|nr:Ni/Fe-hydrogenase cytochrome b subunit [Verrucomicrobiae bacterium]
MSTQQIRLPIGGPIVTRTFYALGALAVLSGALLLWRFVFGIGRVTALNDGYPWGLWIAFDVVVG